MFSNALLAKQAYSENLKHLLNWISRAVTLENFKLISIL